MEKRIEALEVKYKRLKSIYIMSMLTVVAMFVMGQNATNSKYPTNKIIKASEYHLVDENGKLFGRWVTRGGLAEFLLVNDYANISLDVGLMDTYKSASLTIMAGNKMINLRASEDSDTVLQIKTGNKTSLLLGVDNVYDSWLALFDKKGKPRAWITESHISFRDENGKKIYRVP